VLIAQYFGLSNRIAQGYLMLFKEKLHLTTLFSYKTLERAYQDMEVRQILEEVFELTQLPLSELEHEFGPDATGLATSCKQNYARDRQKINKFRTVMRKFWLWWASNTSCSPSSNLPTARPIMNHPILGRF